MVRIPDHRRTGDFLRRLRSEGESLRGAAARAPLAPLLAAILLNLIKGPLEEFGWHGLTLPILQRKLAPIWSGLVLGAVWGLWHLPAFLLSGTPQSAWSFTPFFLGAIAISVIATPLLNTFRGSILLPLLFHFQLNNPVWPDAQPYDSMLLAIVAVLIVWLNRRDMFTRKHAVTRVIPAEEAPT